jgi:hypothetical protein
LWNFAIADPELILKIGTSTHISLDRKAKKCRQRLMTLVSNWLIVLKGKGEKPGYSSGISIIERLVEFEDEMLKCKLQFSISIFLELSARNYIV